jgi:hypothetical protein
MWVLLSSRLRMWVLLSVVVPLLAAVARFAARRIEQSRGPSRLTQVLHSVGNFGRNQPRER